MAALDVVWTAWLPSVSRQVEALALDVTDIDFSSQLPHNTLMDTQTDPRIENMVRGMMEAGTPRSEATAIANAIEFAKAIMKKAGAKRIEVEL